MTEEELIKHRDSFIDSNGNTLPAPAPGSKFPIVVGNWPTKVIGARQVRCEGCKRFCAATEKGLLIHRENPRGRPFFCISCFNAIREQMSKRRIQ